jgi:hypothetical protein
VGKGEKDPVQNSGQRKEQPARPVNGEHDTADRQRLGHERKTALPWGERADKEGNRNMTRHRPPKNESRSERTA